ncbi:hypothetical protein [Wenzhouxiangella sp. XN24]|uniref:hypothetical protein n=1 Tax=Wenzhouxiangella sp. XN24 TaxID=2713569 RepID=UPI0013EC013D|nr:hypothetical protein [Wenzhouxiangella sp. XN24]NGX17021.1 hypothetical protein [Wenzhouxiangella sp. XN24]
MHLRNPYGKLGFLIGLAISAWLTYKKFEAARLVGLEISLTLSDGFDYGAHADQLILYNDELKYLTWFVFRSDHIFNFSLPEGLFNINLYGYFLSGLYISLGDWRPLFALGILYYFYFLVSVRRLAERLFPARYRDFLLFFIAISPTVIELSSGFMRDLLLHAFIARAILALIDRRLVAFLCFAVLIASMRSFYLILLMPVFYYAYSKSLSRAVVLACVCLALSVVLIINIDFGRRDFLEVGYRIVELFFGVSQVLLDPGGHPPFSPGAFEFYSAVQYFVVCQVFFMLVLWRKFRVNREFSLILITGLTLALFYGYSLGFFVPRTKLIFYLAMLFGLTKLVLGERSRRWKRWRIDEH